MIGTSDGYWFSYDEQSRSLEILLEDETLKVLNNVRPDRVGYVFQAMVAADRSERIFIKQCDQIWLLAFIVALAALAAFPISIAILTGALNVPLQ
jgi:hypothetical protein